MKKTTLMALAGALSMAVSAQAQTDKTAETCVEMQGEKCVKTKATEGKCGEGKCGSDAKKSTTPKSAEGKCGEGKCGSK
ncbi:hypothetical protein P9Z71_03425 [Glaesserella parasuis]|uniref:oxazolone/thioamide-modified RiPP metallophore HvfA n=1 Tax=Glaesserella parasuis TaxID=738 RepID=UPI0021BD1970|nr:hypothetical protein [Glaesserella parasuis]MCT8559309.1 hypothetical protein [Glaesserella parasuis]MCT8582014.1 hypothetical protein [Glaesserella parasuis]MCT8585950.1 hypothetical protein [Glaesserella parasuis]MCT8677051.1 hypothetical protein [Glaesserella parasuis]MCT8824194.1 hypothetical protein [Glaesserella parasuis]